MAIGIVGLTAEHDMIKSFPAHRFARTPEERVRWEEGRLKNPPVTHPVIRTHPVSGKRGLFVSEGFTTRIHELSPRESDAVLRVLVEHAAKPEFDHRDVLALLQQRPEIAAINRHFKRNVASARN